MVLRRNATAEEISEAGIDALIRELGPVGMARFLRQFNAGVGDYTEERRAWADDATVDELAAEIRQRRPGK